MSTLRLQINPIVHDAVMALNGMTCFHSCLQPSLNLERSRLGTVLNYRLTTDIAHVLSDGLPPKKRTTTRTCSEDLDL